MSPHKSGAPPMLLQLWGSMRTTAVAAAGGGGVLAAWKTHDAVGLTRWCSSVMAPHTS
ncbi:hypothetical protein STXM2123_5594 [Streptomyces sp. F-3]|nr:hypothetical protein STXM2123_5594 [Streptomyces sp. F-3]